jgi:hypothetical protein
MGLFSSFEYIKLFKDLKSNLPDLQKAQNSPQEPGAKVTAINFLWGVRELYAKLKKSKKVESIPYAHFLDNLLALPDNKPDFEKKVSENMLEVRSNVLHIKPTPGDSQPIGDFSNRMLNDVENWALALFGAFWKR